MTTEQAAALAAPTLLSVEVTINVDGTVKVEAMIEAREGPLTVRRVVVSELRAGGDARIDFAKYPGIVGVGPGYLTAVRVLDLRGRL